MPFLPIPRSILSPRLLLPLALIALLVPFTLALWWAHGIPSTSSLLPSLRIGYDGADSASVDRSGRDFESLGYTGAEGALDRFPANVPTPEAIQELRRAPWAGGWGVPGINPGERCMGHGRYTVGRGSEGNKEEAGQADDLGQGDGDAEAADSNILIDDTDRLADPDNADHVQYARPDEPRRREHHDDPTHLQSARWLGSLSPSSSSPSSQPIPHAAFLLLHFFSTPSHTSGPLARRDLIRRTIFTSIPRSLRRFIDVKFVLAHAWDPALEQVIDREEAVYRDLIRLGTPDPRDTAERGLGVRWVEWLSEHTEGELGQEQEGGGGGVGQREGVWVVKCSDDVLPILPNLIPYLLAQNPSVPTYFGSSLLTEVKAPPYFERHMFGFTWGIVKSLAAAKLDDAVKDRVGDIGLLFGELMYNLPSQPRHLHRPHAERSSNASSLHPPHMGRQIESPTGSDTATDPDPDQNFISHAPHSPDLRTGLVYLDAGARIGPFASPYAARGHETLGWYGIDDDFVYEFDAMAKAISDVRAEGRRYRWDAPPMMMDIVRACERAQGMRGG